MQHPDEGTIHAWLDGALGDAEAARVAGHVATCAECEGRVVEARGLIAGASRVLSALDAVSAGVIPPALDTTLPGETRPPRAAEPDESAPPRERPDERTRHWWRRRGMSPALAAAAAVAFVAVGSTLVLRERGTSSRPAYERVEFVDTTIAAAPMAAASAPESAASAAPSTGAGVRAAAPNQPDRVAPKVGAAPAVVPTGVPPHLEAETRGRVAAKANVALQPSAPAASAPAAEGLAAGAAPSRVADAVRPSARAPIQPPIPLAPPPLAAEVGQRSESSGFAERKAAAKSTTDSAARADRRRATAQLENVVVTSVAAPPAEANAPAPALRGAMPRSMTTDSIARARTGVVSGAFPGCYQVVDRDVERVPRRFVLDTTLAIEIDSDSAGARPPTPLTTTYRARSTDPDRPMVGSWRALGPLAQVAWRQGSDVLSLQLRASTAPRWAARLTVGDSIRTIIVERCEQ